ncbi:MAG TPA: restriction endonuclease [Candidatus Acidoferrales bacterium]|nr:restriction endonuclease [Candidatus Acidoferrales bacterium]
MLMYHKRIAHEGLNTFRVVRGYTPEEVEINARLQLAAWEERWQRKQEIELARQKQIERRVAWEEQAEIAKRKKAVALGRTLEAEAAVQALRDLLPSALARATTFDWHSLLDATKFSTPAPEAPTLKPLPVEPRPDETRFLPKCVAQPSRRSASFLVGRAARSTIEALVPRLRRKRELEAQIEAQQRKSAPVWEFANAHSEWQKLAEQVKKKNESAQSSYEKALQSWNEEKTRFLEQQRSYNEGVDALRANYLNRSPQALVRYWTEVLNRSQYPDSFPRDYKFHFQPDSGTLALDYELPNQNALPRVKSVKYIANRDAFQDVLLSEADAKHLYDDALYQICLRTIHELLSSDEVSAITNIVFNGWVHAIDKATGVEFHACVMTVQVSRQDFAALNLAQVDLKACFRKLKGISGSRLVDLSPVKPILNLNTEDPRFVPAYGVVDTLDTTTNLAAMDWLDFENLIRELFEKEFSQNGGNVKITQASRDGGVDAIAFDPDPIRGGKLVIQAKRYTNTVSVSAVRDLYGTVLNEGATKGILVTTSDYGPDAYEFAKDKPLSLLSGSELLYLLGKHGYKAKIDLKEAKTILGEVE